MKEYIEKLKTKFNSTNDNKLKFELLNNIITLESDEPSYYSLIYQDIKTWLSLYLKVVSEKSFGYDEILYTKIITKCNLVSYEEQIKLIDYFIRLLNKEHLYEEGIVYKAYKKKIEIEYLQASNKVVLLLIKVSTQNIFNMIITLIISVILVAGFWQTIDKFYPKSISINVIRFHQYDLINYCLNIINFIFNNQSFNLTNISSLLFVIIIKLYFYIFLTYFVIKKISEETDRL